MADIEVLYARGDRFLIDVRGHDLVVDQPRQDGGDDAGPTPTELFVTSLAACVGFYAERYLRRHDRSAQGLRVECDYEMSSDRPHRVGSVDLRIVVPGELPEAARPALEAVIRGCTVHNSLTRPPVVRIHVDEAVPSPA
jgi:putative redox protein